MQLWEAFERDQFALHQDFMKQLVPMMEPDTQALLFTTIFDRMHLSLSSIKVEKFRTAESHLEVTR